MFLMVVMLRDLDAEVKNNTFDTIPVIFVKHETLLDNILCNLNYQNQEIIISEPLANPFFNK